MVPGDMIQLSEEGGVCDGEIVIVTKVDEDGQGFNFVIPEVRGHAPMKNALSTISHFDLEKLGITP